MSLRTHGTPSTYIDCHCRCTACTEAVRTGWRRRQQRRRQARRPKNVFCVICDAWFATDKGRNVHESLRHG